MTGDPCVNNWAGVTCDMGDTDVINLELVFFFFFFESRNCISCPKFAFFCFDSSSYFSFSLFLFSFFLL